MIWGRAFFMCLWIAIAVWGLAAFVHESRRNHTPVCEPSVAAPPAVDGLTACLDSRMAEQLKYVEWRGKHARELANCAASLEEATHALARGRR